MKALFLLTAIFFLTELSACALFRGTDEPMRSYVLEIAKGGDALEITKSRLMNVPDLLISPPQPAPGFESPRMAYEQVPHELQYFATSQWVDSPARMLFPLITNALETSAEWGAVIQLPSVLRRDYRLDLSQVVLVQEFTQQPSRIRLTLRAQLVTVYDPRVIGTRSFEFREAAPSEDAYGGVQAAQKTTGRFLVELKHWLQGCLQTGQPSHC
ncbi:MAG: membrane integrity-associated transporter subunit PqiC [Nitrospirales bacterium]|nr:membrane integrity-associated transporter subunit PqiC [Nitrospirales bacterium]MBA3967926.1 membrane integrity-associated transporter subunit PqiC [Nitrospirales bacterium]